MMSRIDRICRLKQADVWALGVTLYSLIYQKLPFYHPDVQELFILIEKCNLKLPSKPPISQGLQSLIKGMLEKKFEKRLTLEDILQNPWVNLNEQDLQEEIILSQRNIIITSNQQQFNSEKNYFTQKEDQHFNETKHNYNNQNSFQKTVIQIKSIILCKIAFIRFRKNRNIPAYNKQSNFVKQNIALKKNISQKQINQSTKKKENPLPKNQIPSNSSIYSNQQKQNYPYNLICPLQKQENQISQFSIQPLIKFDDHLEIKNGQNKIQQSNQLNQQIINLQKDFVRSNIIHKTAMPIFSNSASQCKQNEINKEQNQQNNQDLSQNNQSNKYILNNPNQQIKKSQSYNSKASMNEDSFQEESEEVNVIPSFNQKHIKLITDLDYDFNLDRSQQSPTQFGQIPLRHYPKSENVRFQKINKAHTDSIPFSDENLQNSADLDIGNTMVSSQNEIKEIIKIPHFNIKTSSLIEKLD